MTYHNPMIPADQMAAREPKVETFDGVEFAVTYVNPAGISVYSVLTRTDDGADYSTEVRSNGSKWGGDSPAPLSELVERLAGWPLDRSRFGGFFSRCDEGIRFFGNFATYSHVFNITTDDPHVMAVLSTAIRSNQQRPDYRSQPKYVVPRRRGRKIA